VLLPLILAPVMTWKLDSTVISCIQSVGGGGGRSKPNWKKQSGAPIIIYVYGNVTRNWTREADAD
jgi:hypothetical protein